MNWRFRRQKLKARGVYTLSITRLSDNTLARLCSKNLYIPTDVLMTKAGVTFETISPYFNVAELLCIRYLVYMKKQEEKKKNIVQSVENSGRDA